ncbi:MAG: S-adenosylmethionine decarboxylase [Candidatus Peribacteraceae bacterium]|nr:S-adenosylmethionine decarboxylase [Candidatus Peribacteraceae bacterium]
MFGLEYILDLKSCSTEKFNREGLTQYFEELCDLIDMERCDLHFWDYEGFPEEKAAAPLHLDGTSAIQFIKTSNITIHTLDKVGEIYLNIFSCKSFDDKKVREFTAKFFRGFAQNETVIYRGTMSDCKNL